MSEAVRVVLGEDGIGRCWWCGGDPDYVAYHDDEWGMPVDDDNRLFEKVCLEGFQAGLSWLTILRKRENFRVAFTGFDVERVARFNTRSVERLLKDVGIVRHRGKIESAVNNARRAAEMADRYGSLGAFFWRFEGPSDFRGVQSQTDESLRLSKELKRAGWSFVGPTTMYAFMQSMGMVNDHLPGCEARERVAVARRNFSPPAR